MLSARSPPAKVREAAEARAYDEALWSEIRGLGWPGIAIPEELGGQGLGLVELVILCEELGYACAATPFLSNASAGLFIQHAGSDEQRERWLSGIASGEGRGAAAFEPRSNELVPDADGAAVLILKGDGARRGLRQGAPAVRAADRRLPGGLPPLRRDALRHRRGTVAHLLRGLVRRRRAGVAAARRVDGEGASVRRGLACHQRRAAGARRDRLHVGARPPLPAQAGQGWLGAPRRCAHAPRARRHARGAGIGKKRR